MTGAAAHMSLHLNQQCQRADASPPCLRRAIELTIVRDANGSSQSRPAGERPYMSGKTARQWLFSADFSKHPNRPKPAPHPPAAEGKTPPIRTDAAPRTHRGSRRPKAPKPRRTIQVAPGRPAPRKLDFQIVARELESASAPPADQAHLGSEKLPVKAALPNFPKLPSDLEHPLRVPVAAIWSKPALRSMVFIRNRAVCWG